MPEMPEVEVIRRIIEPQIKGQKIRNVRINHAQIIAYPEESLFMQSLIGQTVKNMTRRGQFLTGHFESGDRLVLAVLADDLEDCEVTVFNIREKICRPCLACGACQGKDTQLCVQKDDVEKLLAGFQNNRI